MRIRDRVTEFGQALFDQRDDAHGKSREQRGELGIGTRCGNIHGRLPLRRKTAVDRLDNQRNGAASVTDDRAKFSEKCRHSLRPFVAMMNPGDTTPAPALSKEFLHDDHDHGV
jgi:hypothetical protein